MSGVFELHNLAKYKWDANVKADDNASNRYLFSQISVGMSSPDKAVLIGPSGQGKSTLLRIMALLDNPDEGDLLLNGNSFRNINTRIWRMAVCYVAQQAIMLPGSIDDNLRTASRLHGQPYDATLALELMGQLGLDYLDISKKAEDCSGGEKQRISLIRSLLLRPSILLLDEITASLDITSTRKVEELLMRWHQEEGTSLIWVTHDLDQAPRISNRTWMMGSGGLKEYSSEVFFNESAAVLEKRFIESVEGSVEL